MKTQIEMLENSLRTNIAMARAMMKIMQLELARRYLKKAQSDKRLLDVAKFEWDLDDTKPYVVGI